MFDTKELRFLPRKGRARKGWEVNVDIFHSGTRHTFGTDNS